MGGAGFLNNAIRSINLIMPGTAMPMIVTREIEDPLPFEVQRYIAVLAQLVKKVTGIGSFVPPAPIIRAAHVRPGSHPQIRPPFPLCVSIQSHGNDWWFDGD